MGAASAAPLFCHPERDIGHSSIPPRRVVTFDLDGTVLDTRVAFVRAHQLAIRDVTGMQLDEARIVGLMKSGMPLRERMAHIEPAAAAELTSAFLERYRRERESVAPFNGMPGLFARLERRGVRLAIVSSKLRDDVLAELAASGLDRYVDAVVAYEDTAEHKPSPAPHVEAMRLTRATWGVGVGDVATDILSIRAAGLAAVGVSWGFGDAESLLGSGAGSVCGSVRELDRTLRELLQSGTKT
jgi:pyrophosphatase PpaX